MSKAGERLIRSVQEALDFVQNGGEGTECLVIPADMPKAERLRLIEEWMGPDAEEGDPAPPAEDVSANNHRPAPEAVATRTPAAQRRVAASGESR